MDDLAKKLNDLLNSPDGLQKIQEAAAQMGILADESSGAPAGGPPASDDGPPVSGPPLADLEMVGRLMPLLNGFKQDDKDTRLLKALRPYLQEERQQRLDETVKMMHLLKVLPLLKDKGGLF